MSTAELFLIAMVIILAAPYLVWRLLRTDVYAPLVVVQIIGGILLGPGVLGAAFPEYYAQVFRPDVIAALNGIAWWAVIMFVWIAGVELDLPGAWRHRRETGTTAGLALGVPLLFGMGAGAIILAWPGWIGPEGSHLQVLLALGMACAVTALPILVLFLERLGLLRTSFGQRVLRYASLDDLAIWALLALILLDWNRLGHQIGFLAGFALASVGIRALFPRLPESDRWFLGLVWLTAVALAAETSGLHFMVGAFLAGAVLDARWFSHVRMDALRDVIVFCLMPIFFLSTGLRTQWEVGGIAVISASLLLLGAAVSGKLAGVHLAGRLLKWPKGEARVIGWLLQTKALIMIIFANILLDRGVISNETFTALLLMAAASTALTIPLVRPLLGRLPEIGPGAGPGLVNTEAPSATKRS